MSDFPTTLVVMAAGMGSRFGGLKQLEPVGNNGEVLLDYSVYDAMKAGFEEGQLDSVCISFDKLDKTKVLYIAAGIMSIGLLGMYFMHFEDKITTLLTFGVAGFIMITGYIFVSALCGALVRDYTPEQDAGKLQGVRMIFSVLIPMLVGPMLGNAINRMRNIPLENAGADAMTTQYIPAPEIFLAGAIVAALMFALIPLLTKAAKQAKENKDKE